jgi:hypothetical protein
MYNNYFNHVNIEALGISLSELRKENEQFEFNVLRFEQDADVADWFNLQTTWWVAKVQNLSCAPVIKKIVSKLETVLDTEFLIGDELTDHMGVRFYLQKQGAELIEHQDYPESNVALNFTFDDNVAPLSFSEIGDVYYRCCLFNVSHFHYVKPSPLDRLMLRVTPMNSDYQMVCNKFAAAGLFLKT